MTKRARKQEQKPECPLNPTTDVLVTVSGGVVTGVFAPQNARVVLIDYDNIKEGDTVDFEGDDINDGPVNCKSAMESIAEAKELIEKNTKRAEEADA